MFFIGLMPASFDLLAEDLRPNPVWEVNTTDTSLATNALKIAKESYPKSIVNTISKRLKISLKISGQAS